jgi:hypothetical protein
MPRPIPSQRPRRVLRIPSFERPSGSATLFNRPRDWQAFERLARDLFARITGDVHMDLHGRDGQPQGGVISLGSISARAPESASSAVSAAMVGRGRELV